MEWNFGSLETLSSFASFLSMSFLQEQFLFIEVHLFTKGYNLDFATNTAQFHGELINVLMAILFKIFTIKLKKNKKNIKRTYCIVIQKSLISP